MKRFLLTLILLAFCSSLAQAQSGGIRAFSGNVHNRGETRILFWDGAAGKAAAEVAISYGRPEWKADYDKPGVLDQITSGKIWRAGKNFFTFIDTNVPIKIGGQDVPVGMYYLAVQRSADGKEWSLIFLNPEETRSKRLDASEVAGRASELSIMFSAPLTFKNRNDTTRILEMSLSGYPDDVSKAIFQLKWGKFELSAPVEVTM